MYWITCCTVLIVIAASVQAVPTKNVRKSNKLNDDVSSENSLEYFGFPFPPIFPHADASIDVDLTNLNVTENISNITEEFYNSSDSAGYANSTKETFINSSNTFSVVNATDVSLQNSTEDSFLNSTELSVEHSSNISTISNFTSELLEKSPVGLFENSTDFSFANSSTGINSTDEPFLNSTSINSTDTIINSTSPIIVLKLFLTNGNDTDENIKDEIINSTYYNTTAIARKNGTTIIFGNSTKEPNVTYRSSGRTRVGLILASTTTPPDPSTVDLAHLKLCSLNASQDEKINLTCQWGTNTGKQLKVWPNHTTVSMCTVFTIKAKHCQYLCEQYEECLSIHFCRECVEYNCRLLTDKKNSSSVLNLTDEYPYVDYHEKVKC